MTFWQKLKKIDKELIKKIGNRAKSPFESTNEIKFICLIKKGWEIIKARFSTLLAYPCAFEYIFYIHCFTC